MSEGKKNSITYSVMNCLGFNVADINKRELKGTGATFHLDDPTNQGSKSTYGQSKSAAPNDQVSKATYGQPNSAATNDQVSKATYGQLKRAAPNEHEWKGTYGFFGFYNCVQRYRNGKD